LALEFVFAHLEAATIQEVMAYRHGSYEMGLAIALVAMVAGMTFATEWKLQIDRKKNIKPAILALKVDPIIQKEMLSIYERKYTTSNIIIALSFLLAVGMHFAIVLMGVFSLQQHELYSKMVLAGEMQPVEGIPPLHYTSWFQLPLTVSSILVGSLGFIIDIMLGFTSNIVEELYKYKPNGEIIKTSKEIETAFPGAGGVTTTKAPTTRPTTGGSGNTGRPTGPTTTTTTTTPVTTTGTGTTTPTTPVTPPTTPTTTPTTTTTPAFDPNKYTPTLAKTDAVLGIDFDLGLSYTGSEATEKLIEDFVKSVEGTSFAGTLNVTDAVDRYKRGSTATKTSYDGMVKSKYTEVIKHTTNLEKLFESVEKEEAKLDDAISRSDEKDCQTHEATCKILVGDFEAEFKKFETCVKQFVAAIDRLPVV
jgi:hypothetical protein